MTPDEIARSYDRIAHRWQEERFNRADGMAQHQRAIAFVAGRRHALDVGCGCSGRLIDLLRQHGFEVEGLDLSTRMLELARQRHPGVAFHHADIRHWTPPRAYDLISAWDSVWHVPLADQPAVLGRLLGALTPGGVCIFTMGGLDGPAEKVDQAMGPPMYYGVLGIPRTLELIAQAGCVCRHLEYDQYPEQHLYLIAQRLERGSAEGDAPG